MPPSPAHPAGLFSASWCAVALVVLAALVGGCASTRVTDPSRTATEQFLLSKAAAEAVEQLSFESLRGRRVFVDTQFFAAAEQAFVIGELRARLLLAGVQLVPSRDLAQVVLEVRSGGVGIDRNDFLVGLPGLLLTPDAGVGGDANVPLATPEIAAVKNLEQRGVASVAYVAYWAETGEIVASSGPYIGRTLRDDWWFFGVGPRTVGDIPTAVRGDPLEAAAAPPSAPSETPEPTPEPPPGTPPPPPPPPGRPYDPALKPASPR